MMNKLNNLYVDIHALQTVPPSCMNRDDTGSPKTATYGGVTRARVSSQAWKRAIRLRFEDLFTDDQNGVRTKKLVALIAGEIMDIKPEISAEDAAEKAKLALEKIELKVKKGEDSVDALFFMSKAQAKALAELVVNGEADVKKYMNAAKEFPSIDLALFGRMVASAPELNYDAAAQVAHSISTHAVHNEYDYFTAVDDLKDETSNGAAHIDTSEYNSSTLYRYANVNVRELANHLGSGSAAAVRGFIEAFITSMPTGKQNSFANRTYPDMVYVTIRKTQPVNLVGAFEKPVKSAGGFAEESEKRFVEYAKKIEMRFAGKPEATFGIGDTIQEIAEVMTLNELLDKIENYISSEVC